MGWLASCGFLLLQCEAGVDYGAVAGIMSLTVAAGLLLSSVVVQPKLAAAAHGKEVAGVCVEADAKEERGLFAPGGVENSRGPGGGVAHGSVPKTLDVASCHALKALERLIGGCMGARCEVGCWPSLSTSSSGHSLAPDDIAVQKALAALRSPPRSSEAPPLIPGFDFGVHVAGPSARPASEWPKDLQQGVRQLEMTMASEPDFQRHKALGFCRDADLARFLLARGGNNTAAARLLRQALHWRSRRMPYWLLTDQTSDVAVAFDEHSRTGKVQVRGHDRFGRSIIVMDGSVENLTYGQVQMQFLAYNLEAALAECAEGVDKVSLIINLEALTMGQAPMSSIRETLEILQAAFPETLGTCVLWQPPSYFKTLFAIIRHLIDAKTLAKVVVIHGPTGVGTENDQVLTQIFGDRWRETTGLGLPRYEQAYSEWFGRHVRGARGYLHAAQWPQVKARDARRAARAAAAGRGGPPWKALRWEDAIDEAHWDGCHPQYWRSNLLGSGSISRGAGGAATA